MFKRTFDFTNETASNPPARKKRLFGCSRRFNAVQRSLVAIFLYKKDRAARRRKKSSVILKKRVGTSRTTGRPDMAEPEKICHFSIRIRIKKPISIDTTSYLLPFY
jgi:hypothetical protein